MSKKRKTKTDSDSAWKDVIEGLFEPFTAFFFPQMHKDIDFSKGIEILDHELTSITPYGSVGNRYADKLVKVYLKDGTPACVYVYIHLEIQGYKEAPGVFPGRAFVYYYRIYDKNVDKGVKVISAAILTDEDDDYRPDEHKENLWGFELRMKFPLVKIIDYKNKPALKKKLEDSTNPMAMVVKAQLRCLELKQADNNKKSTVKYELTKMMYDQKYGKEEIHVLIKFIDWLIRLPDELAIQFLTDVKKLEEDYKMSYVTSFERIAKKERDIEVVKNSLNEGLPVNTIAKITGLSIDQINKLKEKLSKEEKKAAKKTH